LQHTQILMVEKGPSPLWKTSQPRTNRRSRSAATSPPQPVAWGARESPRPISRASKDARRSPQLQQQLVAQALPQTGCAPTPRLDRPTAPQVMQWVERELQINGLQGVGPCLDRVRVLSAGLSQVIELLPSFRPILLFVQKEYDSLLEKLQMQLAALGPMEGRLKTIAAEGYFLVGESMTWYQMEIASLRSRLASAEAQKEALSKELEQLRAEHTKVREAHDTSKSQALDLHAQNLDIVRHLERMERQVDQLRKIERDMHQENDKLKTRVRKKEERVQSVEDQLKTEREKLLCMVPREELETLKVALRTHDATIKDQGEKLRAKQKDYMSLVEAYSKKIGQTLSEGSEGRPLTPRPVWLHCQGLLDPDELHSTEKADAMQHLLQHILKISRSLLTAYGLYKVSPGSRFGHLTKRRAAPTMGDGAEDCSPVDAGLITAAASQNPQHTNNGNTTATGNAWLPPDLDEETPLALRHPVKVKNLRFSRRKTSGMIQKILELRKSRSTLAKPFADFMLDHLPEYVTREAAVEFAINIYASVRRFSDEPDFLAYLMLLQGKLSDKVIKDNMTLCTELLQSFDGMNKLKDGSKTVTKTQFWQGLRSMLPNKDPERLEHIVRCCLPNGHHNHIVDVRCLLLDDPYVFSPVVFALRVQHLEESLELSERLEQVIRGCVTSGQSSVTYEKVEEAFQNDVELQPLVQDSEIAQAFGATVSALKPTSEETVDRLIELMKNGHVFRLQFSPILEQRQQST